MSDGLTDDDIERLQLILKENRRCGGSNPYVSFEGKDKEGTK